jgi:uroporphyrinogen III methyltransferase/synthase
LTGDDKKPLAGRRIVVTRAPEQAGRFVAALEELGAEVLLLSTVAFADPIDFESLDNAIREAVNFDWILFTSRNAVRFFCKRMKQMDLTAAQLDFVLSRPSVAVVGPETWEEAFAAGFAPVYEAEESRGAELVAELGVRVNGKRVLLPRSDKANPETAEALRSHGAAVTEVIAYRTIAPRSFDGSAVEAVRRGEVDAITVFSPSAFENLFKQIGEESLREHREKIALAAIGPTTAAVIRDAGLPVAIEAPSPAISELAKAICDYFVGRPQTERITR